jgi:hypothetical protein
LEGSQSPCKVRMGDSEEADREGGVHRDEDTRSAGILGRVRREYPRRQ